MKFLLPLLALALTTTGRTQMQMDDPHFKTVDEATNKSVREFFNQFQKLYNMHQAHILASYFSESGVWKTPKGEYTGPEAIEKRMNDFDFKHWHVRDEEITVYDVRCPLETVLLAVVGNWTNTVQEDGGVPIALRGWWSAMIFPDGNGSWLIQLNTYGIDE
jgi:hypothetical protein